MNINIISVDRDDDKVYFTGTVDGTTVSGDTWFTNLVGTKQEKRAFVARLLKDQYNRIKPKVSIDLSGPAIDL